MFMQLDFPTLLPPASQLSFSFRPLIKDLPWDTYITAWINWLPVWPSDAPLNARQSLPAPHRAAEAWNWLLSPCYKRLHWFPSEEPSCPLSTPTFIKTFTEFHSRCSPAPEARTFVYTVGHSHTHCSPDHTSHWRPLPTEPRQQSPLLQLNSL